MKITDDKKYRDFCEFQAEQLYKMLYKLKFENYNETTVNYFLKENKIKRKDYEEALDNLYKKCEFLMFRYSKDRDLVEAYEEVDGDRESLWFFKLVSKAYKEKVLFGVEYLIEEEYNIPIDTAYRFRISYM